MDDYSQATNFYLDKKDEIYHYSSKEHPKISKIAKYTKTARNTKILKIC